MKKRPLYLNPRTYTLSATIIGYLLIGDYTANQQNAIGNWFMTIGQILECNSSFQQAIEEAYKGNTFNINSKKFKQGGTPYMNNEPLEKFIDPDDEEIKEIRAMLEKILDKLNGKK